VIILLIIVICVYRDLVNELKALRKEDNGEDLDDEEIESGL
jgi:hypothetical protein